LPVTDLKTLAYELLHEARASLKLEGHLNPVAVLITPSENLVLDVEFESEDEREDIYAEMMDLAKEKSAIAIITVNDVYLDDAGSPARLEGEGWGKLAESAREAIMITVSGGGFETWSLVCPYHSSASGIVFQPSREAPNPGGEVDLLGDWTGKTGAA
jgi:phage pi2 protein 07